MSDLLKRPDVQKAVELYALQPDITAAEVAKELGVSAQLIYVWRKNPNFVDAIYERYMVEFGGELPAVLQAMVREAKAGNVQAGRLVLEHSGKLVKNVNVTIDSPFEKFLKAEKAEIDYEDAEVEEIIDSVPDTDVNLPERKTGDQRQRVRKEKKKIRKAIKSEKEKQAYNKKRREWNEWLSRAKKVGVDALPARRPTPAQKKAWRDENIETKNIPILGRVTCHRLMWEPLLGAINQIIEEGLESGLSREQFKSSGGCYAPRRISRFDAGGSISRHAWGIAIDINTKTGYKPRIVEIFNDWGFAWGGTWTSPDEMHFELRDLSPSIP